MQSSHQIHLTETGQLYALIITPKLTVLVDNTGIMTYYDVTHYTEAEFLLNQEKERLAKEAEDLAKKQH